MVAVLCSPSMPSTSQRLCRLRAAVVVTPNRRAISAYGTFWANSPAAASRRSSACSRSAFDTIAISAASTRIG
jgi:hypothetical protein